MSSDEISPNQENYKRGS